jgi:hypothetical protein
MSMMVEQRTNGNARSNHQARAQVMHLTSSGRGSFREHRTFWLVALALLAIGILFIAFTYSLLGLTAAATVMLVELGLALTAGFR